MDVEHDEIDPEWWSGAFEGADAYEAPEHLSSRFRALADDGDLGELERLVVETLADATSAMLNPGDWVSPFSPAMHWDGKRTALPSDLSDVQVILLARVAPLVDRDDVRARVADIAWTYGDRSNVFMLETAIDAYRAPTP